jgi:large subunit ribosomal protein L21
MGYMLNLDPYFYISKLKVKKMFAVIKTGGKQYKVQQGDILKVEKLGVKKDKTYTFNEVLLIEDGKKTWIGTPFVEKAKVHAVVIEEFKDDKVLVFKKKRRKQYKRLRGHRQELTRVRIEDITVSAVVPKKTKPVEPKPKKPKAAPKKPTVAKKAAETKKAEVKKPAKKAAPPKVQAAKPKTEKPKAKAAEKKSTKPKTAAKTKRVTKAKEK